MNIQKNLLIADDDAVLTGMLSEYFEHEGYRVFCAENGSVALSCVKANPISLVVLDVMMPVLNGIETLKQLRAITDVPVIMLTARGDDLDRILGLELGADDYVAKPCNPRELLARIKAVLRRVERRIDTEQPVSLGDLTLDPRSREVVVGSHQIQLTQTEFDLLHLMLQTPGEVVTKKMLSLEVLGKPLSQWDRSIDVHVSNLRKKLTVEESKEQERIRTLRGSGYMYVVPAIVTT